MIVLFMLPTMLAENPKNPKTPFSKGARPVLKVARHLVCQALPDFVAGITANFLGAR